MGPEGRWLVAPPGYGALRRPLLPLFRSGSGSPFIHAVASCDGPRYAGKLRNRGAVLRWLSVLVRRAAARAGPCRHTSRARAARVSILGIGRLPIGAVSAEPCGRLRGSD